MTTPSLTDKRWDELERRGITRRFIKGGIIYAPDEPASELFVIKEGRVALNLLSPEGRTLTVRVVKAGEVFGHASLLSDGTFDTFAEALRPTIVSVVRRPVLEELMVDRPALALGLMDDLRATLASVVAPSGERGFQIGSGTPRIFAARTRATERTRNDHRALDAPRTGRYDQCLSRNRHQGTQPVPGGKTH